MPLGRAKMMYAMIKPKWVLSKPAHCSSGYRLISIMVKGNIWAESIRNISGLRPR